MTARSYPRHRIGPLLTAVALPESYRIIPARHIGTPLEVATADSRFVSRSAGYKVLYVAPDFTTAFVETVVRDQFVRRSSRPLDASEITERAWVRVRGRPSAALTLLDLREDGCTRIGAPTDAVGAKSHAAGRALGNAIHAEHDDVDGFLFSSRLTERDVYAVFDRAVGKLETSDLGRLDERVELPEILERFDISLVV